jgi:hypothetical protein
VLGTNDGPSSRAITYSPFEDKTNIKHIHNRQRHNVGNNRTSQQDSGSVNISQPLARNPHRFPRYPSPPPSTTNTTTFKSLKQRNRRRWHTTKLSQIRSRLIRPKPPFQSRQHRGREGRRTRTGSGSDPQGKCSTRLDRQGGFIDLQ